MRVLVTGGSGFLGGHIVQELEKRGDSVTIFDIKPPPYKTDAGFIEGDITSEIDLCLVPRNFDVIFHAAGSLGTHTTFDRMEEVFSVNVMGMINLLEWVHCPIRQPSNDYESDKFMNTEHPKVINCGLIRDWPNPYMISKHTASKIGRMYAEVSGVRFLDVRMTVVYGPRQGWKEEKVVPTFILRALRSLPFPIYGRGDSLMNMMYVKDVAKTLVDLSHADELFGTKSPGQMDLANPSGDISVIDFAQAVLSKVDPHATITSRVEWRDMRRGQPGRVDVNYDLAFAYRYLPCFRRAFRSLPDGLDETINWYRGQL